MRIALFGDIHLFSLALAPWHMFSKRVLGQTNLWLNRRTRFHVHLLEQMCERIETIGPDLVLSPGDLTTTALHSEFRLARGAISDVLERQQFFVVPGNHDRYTFKADREKRFEQYFGEFTTTDWPIRRTLAEGVELIGVDASRPNLIFDRGQIGDQQMARLDRMLSELPAGSRVLMLCHYTLGAPPGYKRESRMHNLIEQMPLRRMLADAGHPTLYLHGHVHRPWCWRVADCPNVLAVNAGSPTHVDATYPHGQGIWQIDLPEGAAPEADPPANNSREAGDADGDPGPGPGPWRLTHHLPLSDTNWQATPITPPRRPGTAVELTGPVAEQ